MPKSNGVYPKITHRKHLKNKDVSYGISKDIRDALLNTRIGYGVIILIRLFFALFEKGKEK